MIKAIAFDVFGTLVEIGAPRRPFRELVRLLSAAGRVPGRGDGALIMSREVDLEQAARLLGGSVSETDLARLESALQEEVASIRLFPDAVDTLSALRESGYRIALCSNLAAPYGPPVNALLPFAPDFCAWSYTAGAVKPQPEIYQNLCAGLDCQPGEILMVGDTVDADHTGPRSFGIAGFHLARNGRSPVPETESVASLADLIPLLARYRTDGGVQA
ncbi:HAD family hydrolase [Achromobacter deleyi]|uniref:HAD family hydrolase n=1 Tax=Achromobacter deleyi TaxID=1353891 RepID=UPI001492227B|nr:HAD family hydrolase [Achromobacter deleyi]QVQ26444.1 HAD family hydrolase [Achromobacter deleyi]UIP22013.1 HAD family hydrolase [Achromobacter deleyi]